MKFSSSILALCALPSASAFIAQPNAFQTTALEATRARIDPGNSYAASKSITPNAQTVPNSKFGTKEPVIVQGGSLKTWSFISPNVERVKVILDTEGRPLDSDIELWQGPDNTPHKMRVYVEDGALRPFTTVIETPRSPSTIAVRNTGHLEFPMNAIVEADTGLARPQAKKRPLIIQGGALRTFPFDPRVQSVEVLLKTDGRPLNARIELLQGPNNNKQVVELYTEDGLDRPFYVEIETPGSGNVVRIVNTATVEFPMTAWVEAKSVNNGPVGEAVLGGDRGDFMTRRK